MKIMTTVLAVLLSYNLSALACGGKTEKQYSVKTEGVEVQLPLGEKETIILNSHAIRSEVHSGNSTKALVGIRVEAASDSKAERIAIVTGDGVMYLNLFAAYRCANSPTYTNDFVALLDKYDEVQIFVLGDREEVVTQASEPALVLTSEKIAELLKIKD